jgi:ADP-heptose:LPS heptosyltransferase
MSRLDYVILAAPGFNARTLQMARWLAPRKIVGFSDGSRAARALDLSVPVSQIQHLHEVERVFSLAPHFDIGDEIPGLTLVPDLDEVRKAPRSEVAIHISARRPAQRWPAERFAALIDRLDADSVTLLWSPGAADHPQHPGDDAKAEDIARITRKRIHPYRTERLAQLIGALAATGALICSDGGAMHLAAALGKPIVAMFGDSPVHHWRPWGVRYELVQPASRNVADLTVEDVVAAFARLNARGVVQSDRTS